MTHDIARVRKILLEIEDDIKDLNKEIDRARYVHLPSEVEPGTTHKIKLEDREWFKRTKDLREKLSELKRDQSTLAYTLQDLLAAEVDREAPRPMSNKDLPLDVSHTDLDDFNFALDFQSIAARRLVRMEKIASIISER